MSDSSMLTSAVTAFSFTNHLATAFLLRLALIYYGDYQDSTMLVKFTDIDYKASTDIVYFTELF